MFVLQWMNRWMNVSIERVGLQARRWVGMRAGGLTDSRMDGQTEGRKDGWMKGPMNGQTNGWMDGNMDRGTDRWTNGEMNEGMDRRTDGWMDGADGLIDGRRERQTEVQMDRETVSLAGRLMDG